MKDRFKQEFKVGDTVLFMRSRGNSLEMAGIIEINKNGNARIVDEAGYPSTLLLTRTHRIVKTTDPVHVSFMIKAIALELKRRKVNAQNKDKGSKDSAKDLLSI